MKAQLIIEMEGKKTRISNSKVSSDFIKVNINEFVEMWRKVTTHA